MFEDVLPELTGEKGKGSATDTGTLSSDGFRPLSPSPLKACFVDGGNACVFDSPSARVEYVRVYGVLYDGKGRVETKKEEGKVLVKHDGKGRISVRAYPPLSLELSIPEDDSELSFGKEGVALGTAANLARFLLECGFLERLGRGCELLVRDGPLVGKNTYEERKLKGLLDSGKLVAGLCKTNTLLTGAGASATASAAEQGPKGPWIASCKQEAGIGISIVKLHERSDYAFRLDTVREAERIGAALAVTACDAAFPGYPYPLIEADRMARIPDKELEALKTRFMAEAGPDWRRLRLLARGKDAHGVLDSL